MAAFVLLCLSTEGSAQSRTETSESLAKSGWTAVQERRFQDALEAFTRAVAIRRNDPGLHFGIGFASYMLGQHAEAQASLERALALAPDFVDAALFLGDVHYRNGRLREAMAVYEAALERTPGNKDLEEGLARWKKDSSVRGASYESRGAHFSVRFQGPADDMLARRAVELLEAAYWRIGGKLTVYPRDPVLVILHTQEQFRDISRTEWAAGFYDGTIRVPMRGALERAEDLERLLAHEFVHAVVSTLAGRNVPAWLNEGLAEFFETSDGADRPIPSAAIPLPLARLEGAFGRLSAEEARSAYARSRVAVGKMIQLRGASAVVTLLQDLGRGVPFANAFNQRIAMRYEDFQAMVDRE